MFFRDEVYSDLSSKSSVASNSTSSVEKDVYMYEVFTSFRCENTHIMFVLCLITEIITLTRMMKDLRMYLSKSIEDSKSKPFEVSRACEDYGRCQTELKLNDGLNMGMKLNSS
ncbi:hypothetical protein L1987_50809 [Smallanthus sonchifolius]|uniref:Uncharacterized protein n=1 Tax=Smallanthus sonchifolius TaxID=185202 RepID=A0ACB9ENF7_9ASTR|nr:hypothetical protein L1987_50809 [Smallanthus sonchifolius]